MDFRNVKLHVAGRAVALFGNQQIYRHARLVPPRAAAFVIVAAGLVKQTHQVGILFNRARLPQVRQPRLAVLVPLNLAIQLAQAR